MVANLLHSLIRELLPIGILVIACIYCQIIIKRDKQFRKQYSKRIKAIEKEERRRIKEEELKAEYANHRINHPKVLYLVDYRLPSKVTPKIS